MNLLLKSGCAVAAILLIALTNTPGWGDQTKKIPESLRQTLFDKDGTAKPEVSVAKTVALMFHLIDIEKNGITDEDVGFFASWAAARERAAVVGKLINFDLNNDRIVTRTEIEQLILAKHGKRLKATGYSKRLTDQELEYFANLFSISKGDNIDIEFVYRLPPEKVMKLHEVHWRLFKLAQFLVKQSDDQNRVVNESDVLTLVNSFLAAPITELSPPGQIKPTTKISAKKCTVPKARDGAEIILLSARKGSTIPSVTVAGQNIATSSGRIHFEQGTSPLYLVVTSNDPIIWRMSGATERLQHVVVSSRPKNKAIKAGVFGVEKRRVTFVSSTDCIPQFSELKNRYRMEARLAVSQYVGSEPKNVIYTRQLHELNLPSGKLIDPDFFHTQKHLVDTEILKSVSQFEPSKAIQNLTAHKTSAEQVVWAAASYPGGIVSMNVNTVIGSNTVENYETLPFRFGLLQLINEGKLEHIEKNQFRVLDKFHLPAGLDRGHAVTFIVPKGIPIPSGYKGRSCFLSEDLGGYLDKNRRCP